MDFYNKFTKGARTAFQIAEQTARELGHNYVGTEHILAGLAGEKEGIAYQLLIENADQHFHKNLHHVVKQY